MGGLLLFLYTLFFVYRAVVALVYPYPIAYGEGPVFYEASQLFHHDFNPAFLYLANTSPPYQAAIYPPLFYYLNSLLMWLTGPTSLLAGRLLTILAAAYLGFRLFRVARKEEVAPGRRARLGLSLAAAATPFATAALYTWGVLAQGTLLAFCLSFSAVINIWQAESERRHKKGAGTYILAGFLCALALLCQQTAVAAPLAILIYLGLGLRWREVGQFIAAFFGLFLLISLVFQFWTGDNYLKHVTAFTGVTFDLGTVWSGIGYIILGHVVLLALAGAWVARPLVGRFERVDLWRIYFLIALVVALLTGNLLENSYALESLCLTSLLAWWQVGRLIALRTEWRIFSFRPQVAPLALTLIAAQLLFLWHVPGLADNGQTPGLDRADQAKQVASQLREVANRGPLLAENSGWLAATGLSTDLDDPRSFGELALHNAWDNRLFQGRLEAGYYKTVVFEIAQADLSEAALEKAYTANTATPAPGHFEPAAWQIIQDRTKFTPLKRIGRWVFLAWKS
ncbi:MAG: hypothetical protein BGO39_26700 [Chloroflexi bacterium 54-19]|nr:MAG: hypothetical protein BGO39_26700 [Chloroflexi bacterium 54-19]